MKKTALLSVYNKKGIVSFAKQLLKLEWRLISSGGTAKVLRKAGLPVTDVAKIVGSKAILGHRVVTLSREIHAGLLARDIDEDKQELKRLGIPWIDLVCNDLYPLEEEIDNPKSTPESVIEKTDIGGPTLLRSAAKGRRIVICDPSDRQPVISWLKLNQPNRENFINHLVAKVEFVVAKYCLASSRYHSQGNYDGIIGERISVCKYGENPWQAPAGLYSTKSNDPLALDKLKDIGGTDPSHNNFCDLDRLLQIMTHIAVAFKTREMMPYIAVGVKHGNACGAAIGPDQIKVLKKMVTGDSRAIFGGSIITNFKIGEKEAKTIFSHGASAKSPRLLDAIIAPKFTKEAIEILERKNGKCRLKENSFLNQLDKINLDSMPRFRYVRGGFLGQPNYTFVMDFNDPELVRIGKASHRQENNLILAWAIGSTSNSNTITLVKNNQLIANGIGQQDRVGCCELAVDLKAKSTGHNTTGAVAYSDSFFPFTDGPQVLAKAGIKAILASNGSIQDKAVIELCKKEKVVLYLIPDKKGRGFFGH